MASLIQKLALEGSMVILGVLLLIIGFATGVGLLWAAGGVVLVIGLVLWALGSMGHAIGGRHHYY